MVRDAYSAGGQQPSLEADGSTPHNHLLDIRSGTANLTQELAQLLAASIAQGTPSKRPPTGAGSELASLAALVSASQNQRTVSPTFRDGLSALSYTPPPPSLTTGGGLQSPGVALQPTGSGLQLAEQHDDEPMPIPSTWRQPIGGDDERWYRQQVGAAVLGLVAGLIVVVPAVLWLSGWLGGPQTRTAATRQPTADQTPIKTADVKPVKVQVRPVERVERTETASQYATAAVDPRVQAEPQRPLLEQTPVAIPAPRAEPPRPRTEDLLAQAERRIEGGDINGAREILVAVEGTAPGPAAFALAETYDPNMLAAWGTRGVSADVAKAKALYIRALDLGVSRAQMRLEQLR
jgi:hypothetical protein